MIESRGADRAPGRRASEGQTREARMRATARAVEEAREARGEPVRAPEDPPQVPLEALPEVSSEPASSRTPKRQRGTTLHYKELARRARAIRTLLPESCDEMRAEAAEVEAARPKSWSTCQEQGLGVNQPCPFVACKHHLYLDMKPKSGSVKLNFPNKDVNELQETCALAVADKGGISLEETGALLNLTRERIRQIEMAGLLKLRAHLDDGLTNVRYGLWMKDVRKRLRELSKAEAENVNVKRGHFERLKVLRFLSGPDANLVSTAMFAKAIGSDIKNTQTWLRGQRRAGLVMHIGPSWALTKKGHVVLQTPASKAVPEAEAVVAHRRLG